MTRDRGFTLIELLVVVVIIGILIAIAIPLYLNYTKGANDKGAHSDVRNAVAVLEQCFADNGSYPTTITVNTAGGACAGQRINVSNGTTLTYRPSSDNGSYIVFGVNSSGSVVAGTSYYCYAKATSGQIIKKTGAVPTAYATSC